MEFGMKTLVTFGLLAVGALLIILFIQSWTGEGINMIEGVYEFFRDITGIG